jgi:hypothetical protein
MSAARKWREAKRTRYEQVGGRCEECGTPLTFRQAVGHHVISRRYGIHTPENCRIRCPLDEVILHFLYPGGNPTVSPIVRIT